MTLNNNQKILEKESRTIRAELLKQTKVKNRVNIFQVYVYLTISGNILHTLSNEDSRKLLISLGFISNQTIKKVLEKVNIQDRGRSIKVKKALGQVERNSSLFPLPYWHIKLETYGQTTANCVKKGLQSEFFRLKGDLDTVTFQVKKKEFWEELSLENRFEISPGNSDQFSFHYYGKKR